MGEWNYMRPQPIIDIFRCGKTSVLLSIYLWQTFHVAAFQKSYMVNSSTPAGDHIDTGKIGEDIAEEYLISLGYKMLGRNVKTGRGEVDIIAKDSDITVFVEVKTKSRSDSSLPSERVDSEKISRLKCAAETWIDQKGGNVPSRIDVIGVCNKKVIEHYKDITGL
ncbi:YraN family protein [Candidatus Peribacteria bacterium]|jgi:putative endonuclease|nr:YraN family protein [Candidatus Peribacteria bacterium]MBT4020990.1 YraN family protein [Candidatus Peribacteria bacterium]MBT4240889.1 YraN family protein [Candidatus Peribacteria bacterium]MBT4474112.1 YraN family protein [Candidatus Peribacteria bacterium]